MLAVIFVGNFPQPPLNHSREKEWPPLKIIIAHPPGKLWMLPKQRSIKENLAHFLSTTQAESLRKTIKELLDQGMGRKSKYGSWAVLVLKCVSWWLGMKIKMGSNLVTRIREANVYWGLGMKMVCQILGSAGRLGSISAALWVLHGGAWAHFLNSGWQSSLQVGARQLIKIFTAQFFSFVLITPQYIP